MLRRAAAEAAAGCTVARHARPLVQLQTTTTTRCSRRFPPSIFRRFAVESVSGILPQRGAQCDKYGLIFQA